MDFWISSRLGFHPVERAGISVNRAVALTWLIAVGAHVYFVSLPGWFIAALS